MNRRQYVILARHVVCFWGHGSQRRPPKHILSAADAQQVGQVGMAAGELLEFDSLIGALNAAVEIDLQRGQVKLFACADRRGVFFFDGLQADDDNRLLVDAATIQNIN